jgi:hypothetical protein
MDSPELSPVRDVPQCDREKLLKAFESSIIPGQDFNELVNTFERHFLSFINLNFDTFTEKDIHQ